MSADRQRTARRFRELDTAVPPRTRELTEDLRAAHLRAGCPSFIELDERNVEAGRGRLTKATLSRIFTPDPHGPDLSLPAWSYYEDLLRVLGEDPETYRERREAAQQEWRDRHREPDSDGQKKRWRRPVLIGGAVVVIAAGAFFGIRTLVPNSAGAAKAPISTAPAAPLVTGTPLATVEGTIVRTYNKKAGQSIGVRVFPSPYRRDGAQNGPGRDGAVVDVVCHLTGGRSVHENLEPPGRPKDSTGWYRIYFGNRLWYVSDHYVEFPPGRQPPNC